MLNPTGIRVDLDKEVKDMNKEERDVFNCLEDDDEEAYEDIGMDILDYVNEGQVAVVKDDAPEMQPEHANKDVHVFTDAELMTDEDKEIDAMRKAALAMLPPGLFGNGPPAGMPDFSQGPPKRKFSTDSECESVEEEQTPDLVPITGDQKALDAQFAAFMDLEYTEDKMGPLGEEEIPNESGITQDLLMHHVDEFIEGKKMQFHKLNKYHGTGEQPDVNLTKSD